MIEEGNSRTEMIMIVDRYILRLFIIKMLIFFTAEYCCRHVAEVHFYRFKCVAAE